MVPVYMVCHLGNAFGCVDILTCWQMCAEPPQPGVCGDWLRTETSAILKHLKQCLTDLLLNYVSPLLRNRLPTELATWQLTWPRSSCHGECGTRGLTSLGLTSSACCVGFDAAHIFHLCSRSLLDPPERFQHGSGDAGHGQPLRVPDQLGLIWVQWL